MTPFDRFDRRLGDALDDLASPQFPDYFDDVLAQAIRHPQRPAWTFLERWIPMSTLTRRSVLIPALPWRTIGILLMLLALLVATAVISIGLRDRSPAPPFGLAANGLVAYVSEGDIYTLDLATGEEELLVGGSEDDVFPQFSRDGLSLAWFRLEPALVNGATLMVANADGTDARAVFGPTPIDSAAWSPSSEELAVVAAGDLQRTLSIVPIRPGRETRVLELPVVPEGQVEWRPPDGDELIFHAAGGSDRAIYAIRPDGSGFRPVSATGGVDSFWGPYHFTMDGSQMLFVQGDLIQIGILDLETGSQRTFGAELPPPPDYDGGPQHHGIESISPDGATILFGRYWNQEGDTINHQLYVASIDGDGADAVAVGPIHRSQAAHNPFWQAFAPDGESVLVVENDTNLAWITRLDGREPEPVDLRQLADPPTWQRVAP